MLRVLKILTVLLLSVSAFSQCKISGVGTITGTGTWGCPPLGTLQIATNSLPNGIAGDVYSPVSLQASSGTAPYTWSLAAGSPALPSGLSLSSGGVLSGTLGSGTGGQNYFPNFQVTDNVGATATRVIEITVTFSSGTIVISGSCPNGTENVAYSCTLSLSGGTIPYTCSKSAGTFPSGVSISTSGASCVISGTPALGSAGTYTPTIHVTDTTGDAPANLGLSFTIAAASGSIAQDPDFYCPLGSNPAGTWPIPTPTWGTKDGPATLPTICLNTTPANTPSQTNHAVSVTSGSWTDLNSKITGAACGDIITVPVATYAGTQSIVMPNKNCADNNWITIQSSDMASLPAYGQRVDPCFAGYPAWPPNDASPTVRPQLPCFGTSPTDHMPLITNSSVGAAYVMDFSNCTGHCNFRIQGLELGATYLGTTGVVIFNTGIQYKANVVFDRDFMHCPEQGECSFVAGLGEASDVAFVGDYMTGAYCLGNPGNCIDSEDITGGLGNDTKSGLKVYNSYGDATGHGFESGGGGQLVTSATWSDHEWRDSYLKQLDAWFLAPDFSLSPHNATVAPNGTLLIEAQFLNMTNAAVLSVTSVTCGTASIGADTFYQERFDAEATITYTAPASPTTCTLTVKATHASQTATASTTITVTNSPQAHVVEVIPGDLSVNPQGAAAGVRPGDIRQFWSFVDPALSASKITVASCGGTGVGYNKPATCPNGSDSAAHQANVNWYVCTDSGLGTCTLGGNATVGTISNSSGGAGKSGLYTAPSTIPASNPCVKAVATADNTSYDYSCIAISTSAKHPHATGNPGQLKYLWECKSCQRSLFEGNILDTSYAQSDEQGFLFSFTPKNQAAGKYTSSSIVRNGDGTVTITSTTSILSNIAVNENVNVTGALPNDLNGLFVVSGTPPGCTTSGFCTPCKHGSGTGGACTSFQFEWGQAGAAETATTQGSAGISVAPAAEDQNITVRYSKFKNTCDGSTIGVGNSDNGGPPFDGGFFSVHDNLFVNLNCAQYNPINGSSQGFFSEIAGIGGSAAVPIHDFELKHNTSTLLGNNFFQYGILSASGQNYNLRIHDNILYSAPGHGGITWLSGFCGNPIQTGLQSCGTFTNGASTTPGATCNTGTPSTCTGDLGWFYNVLVGGTGWMTGSPFLNIQETAIGNVLFVNYTGDDSGDYRLCSGNGTPAAGCTSASPYAAGQAHQASDGTDMGANVGLLNQYINGVGSFQ